MASRIQTTLQKPYDRVLFGKEVLSPIFGPCLTLKSGTVPVSVQPNKSEQSVIQSVSIYGNINLEDGTEITCYEINLQPSVRIEHSKVAIQRYVRKLLTAGQIALVNFIAPKNKNVWRLTLVAKDSELTDQGIKEKTTQAKRYTYLLGPSETCKTAAERFESLSNGQITYQALVNAFSVEKLSKAFFDEYTLHYQQFCEYLQESNFRKSVFNISIPANANKEEKDKAFKPIRDFVKKLLGRIVFLYFVQKKGWLGASDTDYKDGLTDFIKQLFKQSGGSDAFYSTWLSVLFFETLNKERTNDDFKMPDGKKVKVPFLNGGLFDKEDHDKHILTFKSKLFHHPDFEDTELTEKNRDNARGFLDFLNAFNFTVHEDSPDDSTVAVDPEMLGHIFENLLEDNKDKGTFYTPKEIVHYMCQESLTEYLTTHLSKEYTVYKEIGNAQVELFGNETHVGQLKMMEQLGAQALKRDDVSYIVEHNDISQLTKAQLERIDSLLDTVKICDPAIGSGAFPMGLLQEIHAIKEIIAFELQKPWKPAEVKENIIQNSIYGVDIEKGAVDIARLRFWLSLVVDEEKPRALPNLDYKIVVGDSLISKFEGEIIEIDWERKQHTSGSKVFVENIQRLLKEIAEKQKKFFKPDNKDKRRLQEDIRTLKLELLINQINYNKAVYENKTPVLGGFAPTTKEMRCNAERELTIANFDNNITKLQNLKKNKEEMFEHFDWRLDFPEVLNPNLAIDEKQRGFDIVIGNPPYVSNWQMSETRRDEVLILNKKYEEYLTGHWDIFICFIPVAINIAKRDALFTYILPTSFYKEKHSSKIRKHLIEQYKIIELLDFDEEVIFENVARQTGIIRVQKKTGTNNLVKLKHKIKSTPKYIGQFFFNELKGSAFKLDVSEKDILIHKIVNDNSSLLGNYVCINTGVVAHSKVGSPIKFTKDDVIKNYKGNGFKPYIRGINMSPYYIGYSEDFIDYESNKEYFHRPKFPLLFETEKIVVRRISGANNRFVSSYDNKGYYSNDNLMHVKLWNKELLEFQSPEKKWNTILNSGLSLKYILAILNSKLNTYYFKNFLSTDTLQGSYSSIYPEDIRQVPIKIISQDRQKAFEKIVDFILFLKTQTLIDIQDQLISTYFEQIIDGMVYELYFLELIKKHKREIMSHLGDLPGFTDKISDENKMSICKTVFNRLNERDHPIRINLFYMNSIPEIATIEGINENN